MPEYLYLDIETLPTSDPLIIAEITGSLTPPKAMTKPETIAAWEADTKPGLVAEAVGKTALSGALGSVCCVGFAWGGSKVESVMHTGEGALFSYFINAASDFKPSRMNNACIVGHNVAGFDIRFLWQRAFALGIVMPTWFPRDPKPWSGDVNDTMTIWGGAKDYISLDNLCRALGLPGKGNVTGADVAGMWARGEHEAIAEYCRADVERVRNVHRKMLVAMGEVA